MSLPEKYGKKLRGAIGGRAVWLPGQATALGDIMIKDDGVFKQTGDLASSSISFKVKEHLDRSLDLKSSGTSEILVQANAQVKPQAVDLNAEATLKLQFSSAFDFLLKAPTLRGQHITNLSAISGAIAKLPGWRHREFFIVHELYSADQFSFLGTTRSNTTIELSGKGSDVSSFVTAGASAGLKKQGSVAVELLGKGGPVAMGLVRVKKDGSLDFD